MVVRGRGKRRECWHHLNPKESKKILSTGGKGGKREEKGEIQYRCALKLLGHNPSRHAKKVETRNLIPNCQASTPNPAPCGLTKPTRPATQLHLTSPSPPLAFSISSPSSPLTTTPQSRNSTQHPKAHTSLIPTPPTSTSTTCH